MNAYKHTPMSLQDVMTCAHPSILVLNLAIPNESADSCAHAGLETGFKLGIYLADIAIGSGFP